MLKLAPLRSVEGRHSEDSLMGDDVLEERIVLASQRSKNPRTSKDFQFFRPSSEETLALR